MKKSLQERLNASLDKALDPPRRRPKQELDALLEEYDDGQAIGAQRDSASEIAKGIPAPIPEGIPEGIPASIPTVNLDQPQTVSTPTAKQHRRAVKPTEEAEQSGSELFVSVDATHTASEKIVYSHMYRETVSKGRAEGHFGPALLMKLSGIRSRNTVHKAFYGLIEKLSIEKVAESQGNPFGPRYRVYGPQEILRRRKTAGMVIDPQTKKIIERGGIPEGIPASIPAGIPSAIPKIWDTPLPESGIVGIPNFGILLNRVNILDEDSSAEGSSSNLTAGSDDEAYARLISQLRQAVKDVTGRESTPAEAERWGELGELLVTELKIAAGRTGSVSSVPAFLTEHLRRRLWKKEKRQLEEEGKSDVGAAGAELKVDASKCPDCFGAGMWYPEGFEKGVAKCRHEKLWGAD